MLHIQNYQTTITVHTAEATKLTKMEQLIRHYHNLYAEIAIKLIQSGQTQYFTTQKKTYHSGKNTLNYFHKV